MKTLAIILVTLLLGACGPVDNECPDPQSGDCKVLRLSPDMPPAHEQAMLDAISAWREAAPVDIRVEYLSKTPNVFVVDEIPSRHGEQPAGETQYPELKILLWRHIPSVSVWEVAAHELGHWLIWRGHAASGLMSTHTDTNHPLHCIDEVAAAPLGGKGNCEMEGSTK